MNKSKIRISVILLSLVVSSVSFAQNWNFIKPNERYHFKHKDDTIPLNTILIDSIKVEGNNTTNYLNRLFLPCDTCSSEGFYLDNQPGFLQREFVYSQVSSTVQLTNPEQYTIHLPDNELKEWWFDEAKTQKAKLGSVANETIFGIEDSIATINIDGEPKIKIAKKLGLIKYFDYELLGLENAQLGECLPGWKDFYDFEVGDVFQYFRYLYRFGARPPTEYNLNKYKITAIEEFPDSIRIGWDKVSLNTFEFDYEMNNENNQIDFSTLKTQEAEKNTESGNWVISKNSISNSYHNQLIHVKYEKWFGVMEDFVPAQYSNSGDVVSLKNGNHFKLDKDSIFYTELTMHDHAIIAFEFLSGFGNVSFSVDDFYNSDWNEEERLIGSIKNGTDTIGVVFDDNYSTVFDTNTVDTTDINSRPFLMSSAQVFPNPSKGSITFDLGKDHEAKIEIYTLEGRLVEQFETKNNQIQNLQLLNSGIYIISIKLKDGLQQIKWIKQ